MSFPTEGSDTERERAEFVGVLRILALPEGFSRDAATFAGLLDRGTTTRLALDLFVTIRKFPAFRRALCEAVAQETGMKVAEVIALATPKE